MGRKDLSKLRAGLKRGMEIDSSINSLTDKRDSLNRSKRKRETEIEKLGSSASPVIDPSSLTVKRLKQILGHNDLPTGGVKKELVARLEKNNISLQHEPEFKTGLTGYYSEEKLPELAGRVKLLKSQVKEQERIVKPLKKMKHEADSRVKKAKKSWIYFDVDREPVIAFVCGIILAFSIVTISQTMDDAGIIDVFDDEEEIQGGFFGTLYVLLMLFSCCILPFMGGTLVAFFPSMLDPASVAVKLQNSAEEELRRWEAPLDDFRKSLASAEHQITQIELMNEKAEQNRLEIEKGREQIKEWDIEIEDLNMEISKLRIELKEVYADIKHLLPYSYMLE